MVSSGSGRTPMEKPAGQDQLLQHQQQSLKCPRCDSSNTKFCYYNNYSLSQPRHFCKSCKRYWTRGGTLRNVPVGGGCRKNKRLKRPPPSSSSSAASDHTPPLLPSSSSSAPTTANSDLPSQPHIVDNPINNPLFYGLPTTNSNSDMTLPFPRFNSGYDHHLQHPHLNALGLGFSSGFASNDTLVSSYNSIFGNSSSSNSMASLLISPTTLHQQKLINGGLKEDGLGTNNNNTNFQGLAPLEGVKAEERQNLQIMEHGGLLSDYSPYYWNAATAMGAWSDQSNNVGLI